MINPFHIGDQRTLRIALNSVEDMAYLAGGNGDEVIVVNLTTHQIVDRIRIGQEGDNRIVPARGIAISPDDGKLFVSNAISQTVSVIDTRLREVIDTLQVALLPSEIEISPDGKRVYVLHQHTTDIMTIIDAESHKTLRIVNFPGSINGALDFFLSPDERYVYIACFDPNWIMVYDLLAQDPGKAVKKLIITGLDPYNVSITADKRLLYVTNFTSDNIVVIDTRVNEIVDTISIGDLTGIEKSDLGDVLYNHKLSQNYPNPFNPITYIRYELSIPNKVELKVFDFLGREVASLVNEEKIAGRYECVFDGSEFPSGVYFYRLVVDNHIQTKRFVLLK
jgi:YVTN family beta-propeller protein